MKHLSLLPGLLLCGSLLTAQTQTAPARKCATPPGTHADYEAWISQQMQKDNAFANVKKTATIYNIPVVFHIIHSGQAVGTGYNISQAQVNSQITILNKDYSKTNTDFSTWVQQTAFTSVAADCGIQFCLATIRPDGSTLSEPGIDRISTVAKGWTAPPYVSPPSSNNFIENTIKPNSIWDPTKYLNIWVLAFNDGTLGYAQFPTVPTASTPTIGDMYGQGGNANTDGVVFDYTAVGDVGAAAYPYDKGRTASHEIGHFFGLYHPDGDSYCGDDYCNDTPTLNTLSSGCPTQTAAIVSAGCSASPNPPGKMYQNYMDYSDDRCLVMFTNDQKARMMACIQYCTRRTSLTTSTVCATPNGVHENSNAIRSVAIYPNPSNGDVTLTVNADNIQSYSVSISNTLGQTVYETKKDYIQGGSATLSLAGQAPGVYFVKVSTAKGSSTQRLVLQ